jgi:uncharacterized membrane protein YsdA (DUF1294 family)
MSGITALVYAVDKKAAIAGTWRVPEKTLLTLGFACGWPGGLIAQQLFRHKSSKKSFLALFWISVALNVAALFLIKEILPITLGNFNLRTGQ